MVSSPNAPAAPTPTTVPSSSSARTRFFRPPRATTVHPSSSVLLSNARFAASAAALSASYLAMKASMCSWSTATGGRSSLYLRSQYEPPAVGSSSLSAGRSSCATASARSSSTFVRNPTWAARTELTASASSVVSAESETDATRPALEYASASSSSVMSLGTFDTKSTKGTSRDRRAGS
eukprot:Amastigsp_a510873_153.p2 type:complete len:179 gc:universal Amastigsp_a510873_153:770-234(-)